MDFWLMVWQEKCPLIVMLTREVEGKKLKCHQYWPKDEGHSMLFGSLRVTLKRQTSLTFWKERLIYITHNETHEVHVVEHYQFIGWPDHGVPSNPSDFFTFMGHIYIRHQTIDPEIQLPILLHCSAGVGRTGAFIIIYSAMRELYGGNGLVDVQTLVKKLRERRKYMVQKKEQYEFCYKAILYSAEQFLILENTAKSSAADSSDSSSSSDDSYSSSSDILSDDDQETIPDKPPKIPFKPQHIIANKPVLVPEPVMVPEPDREAKPESTNQNSQGVEPDANQDTLNNFEEICTGGTSDDDVLAKTDAGAYGKTTFEEHGGTDGELMADTQETSKEGNMGETKYKEITEKPEKKLVPSESASVIPGLQEIQGVVKKASCEEGKDDSEFKIESAVVEKKDGDGTVVIDENKDLGMADEKHSTESSGQNKESGGLENLVGGTEKSEDGVKNSNEIDPFSSKEPEGGILLGVTPEGKEEDSEKESKNENTVFMQVLPCIAKDSSSEGKSDTLEIKYPPETNEDVKSESDTIQSIPKEIESEEEKKL